MVRHGRIEIFVLSDLSLPEVVLSDLSLPEVVQ
jgi:hypothetical protein